MEIESSIKVRPATDERQYMIEEDFEIYEKQGAPIGAASFHYHHFYEIIYVLDGEYSSLIEDKSVRMRKGDFLLIDQNVMHRYEHVEGRHDSSKRIILWITPQMLARLSDGHMDLAACFKKQEAFAYHFPIYYEELLQGYLLKLAMRQMPETGEEAVKKTLDKGLLTLFFTYLNVLCDRKEYLFTNEKLNAHPLVEQVSAYIDHHIGEKITVDMIAEEAHMSKYYFLRKFKELTGVTVHSFIVNKRLLVACKALREGKSVTESVTMSGFSDYTSFLRNFRETFGVAPGKYVDFYSK